MPIFIRVSQWILLKLKNFKQCPEMTHAGLSASVVGFAIKEGITLIKQWKNTPELFLHLNLLPPESLIMGEPWTPVLCFEDRWRLKSSKFKDWSFLTGWVTGQQCRPLIPQTFCRRANSHHQQTMLSQWLKLNPICFVTDRVIVVFPPEFMTDGGQEPSRKWEIFSILKESGSDTL